MREENREMMEQVIASRLSQNLGLTDEQSIVFMRRFGELGKQQRQLRMERQKVIRELRKVTKQENDEKALNHLLGQLEDLNRRGIESEDAIRGAFKDMDLNIWQKAKVELFLIDFQDQMRRIVQQARNKRGPAEGLGPEGPRPHPRPLDGPPRRPRPADAPGSPPPPPPPDVEVPGTPPPPPPPAPDAPSK